VDEDLINQVTSGPRMLQTYVMETTEEKENMAKFKKGVICQEMV
jgi:hypothetical protein